METETTTGMIPSDGSGERYLVERHQRFLELLLMAGRWLQFFYEGVDNTSWVEMKVNEKLLGEDLQRLKDETHFTAEDLALFREELR